MMRSTSSPPGAGPPHPVSFWSQFGPGRQVGATWGTPYGYLLAVAITFLSLAVKLVLAQVSGLEAPFLLFPVAVLLAAWFGGVGPGLLTTFLSAFLTAFYLIAPARSMTLGSHGFLQICLYVLESLTFCWFAFVVYRDRERLQGSKATLERELAERRRAEQALRESEQRFRSMADQVPAMIWMCDVDGSCTYVNRPRLSFTGRTLQQEMGTGWAEVVHPEDAERLQRTFRTAFDTRTDFEAEYRLRRFDGEYRWVMDRGTPRFLATGGFAGYIGSVVDVTERRQAAQEIRTRSAQNEAVARLAQEAIQAGDLGTLMHHATQIVADALGTEYGEVLEWRPGLVDFLLRAGVGWKEGCVGRATVPDDGKSQAGYAVECNEPVLVEDIINETRFTVPPLLHEHGVVSGISVVIPGAGGPFGVLGAHCLRRRAFTKDDAAFLQAVAHVLATTIEQRRTAARLAESELRYRTLFNGANDAIVVYHLNADGTPTNYIEVNDVTCRRLGYTREEMLALSPMQIADPSVVSIQDTLQRLRDHGTIVIESMHLAKSGERLPVEVSAHLFEMNGRPTILSVCRDIADRKRADAERAELLQRERAAREESEAAERRTAFLAWASAVLAHSLDYQATLQALAGLVVPHMADWCTVDLVGPDGTIQRPAIAHVDPDKTAWAREILERYKPDLDAPGAAAQVIRTGRTAFYPEVSDKHLAGTTRDKEHLELLRTAGFKSAIMVPLKAHGHILGAMTLIWAESDRRYTEVDVRMAEDLAARAALAVDNARLYEEAREAEQRAEEMARLKSAFLANMSHEIRTPLQGVIGFASLLARQASGKHQGYAQRIMSSGQRLMDTLNAVLTLAKLEAHRAGLDLEPVAVAEETAEIVQSFQRRADEKGLTLQFQVEPGAEAATARLDAGGLSSALHNIIGNAIKFTDAGRVEVTVSLTPAGDTGRQINIRVHDTGIGIGPEFLPRLFDAFQQESSGLSRSHEGTGLGLSIAHRLVQMMGGEIHVTSEKGRGSTFTLSFPAWETHTGRATEVDAPPSTLPTSPRAKILLVEDNADSQEFVQALLRDACEVIMAANAGEAMHHARAALLPGAVPFDLVLLDVNLGSGPNGLDVIRELREMPAYRETPIVAITAYALPGDRDRFIDAGFTDYIGKPFTADELLERTSQLLAR